MKITVFNKNKTFYTISKTNGVKLNIPPLGSVSFITDDDREMEYWSSRTPEYLNKYGLAVEFDSEIWQEVSATNSCVSEYGYEQIVGQEQDVQTSGYTEDQLLKMDKEDLFNICKNFDIPFKRNNSVKTLVKMILEKVG